VNYHWNWGIFFEPNPMGTGTYLDMLLSGLVLTLKTAALACKRFFEFELIVPCHYRTFPVLDQTADKFIEEMHSDSVLVPEVGVAFEA